MVNIRGKIDQWERCDRNAFTTRELEEESHLMLNKLDLLRAKCSNINGSVGNCMKRIINLVRNNIELLVISPHENENKKLKRDIRILRLELEHLKKRGERNMKEEVETDERASSSKWSNNSRSGGSFSSSSPPSRTFSSSPSLSAAAAAAMEAASQIDKHDGNIDNKGGRDPRIKELANALALAFSERMGRNINSKSMSLRKSKMVGKDLKDMRMRNKPYSKARVSPAKERPLKCFRCLGYGHIRAECNEKNEDRSNSCFLCNLEGHKAVDCPNKGKPTKRKLNVKLEDMDHEDYN